MTFAEQMEQLRRACAGMTTEQAVARLRANVERCGRALRTP
jgi:hypothetical protein